MTIKDFRIADFQLRIQGRDWMPAFGHFGRALTRFEIPTDEEQEPVLTLHTDPIYPTPNIEAFSELESFNFAEVNASCRLLANDEGHLLVMQCEGEEPLWFIRPRGEAVAYCNMSEHPNSPILASLIRFGTWIMFGIAITLRGAIAIHSSTIHCGEWAALFLGESGTGKSTHTRLWREHIAGATLLNDDSPIIRMREGVATVYGSPWSGKTPCYKQEHYPIRGFVRLSQAPHNKMRRLGVIPAIGALLPSCPPAFAYDKELQDAICQTLSQMIGSTAVYHLECLPDQAAAELSYSTLCDGHTNH